MPRVKGAGHAHGRAAAVVLGLWLCTDAAGCWPVGMHRGAAVLLDVAPALAWAPNGTAVFIENASGKCPRLSLLKNPSSQRIELNSITARAPWRWLKFIIPVVYAPVIIVPPKCRTQLFLSPLAIPSTCINNAILVTDVRQFVSTSEILSALSAFLVTILLRTVPKS